MMKSTKNKKGRVQSEIGMITYGWTTAQVEVKVFGKTSKVDKKCLRFQLYTIGPNGRAWPYTSDTFDGITKEYRNGTFVEWNENAHKAFNDFVKMLWKEGWEPTSFGQAWYDFKFRRPVPEPEPEPSAKAAAPASAPAGGAPPEAFSKIEARYTQLRAELAAGKLNPDRYRAALQELRVQEPGGTLWMIDGQSGRWLKLEGTQWVKAEPRRG